MQSYVFWFVLAFVLLVVEMNSGTFYFLALSVAAAVSGVAAQMGASLDLQLAIGGVVAVAGTLSLHYLRRGKQGVPDIGPDIGQAVKVVTWHEDGSARVHYRGAEWDAEVESADTPHQETLYIKAMSGNKLILTQHKPQ